MTKFVFYAILCISIKKNSYNYYYIFCIQDVSFFNIKALLRFLVVLMKKRQRVQMKGVVNQGG